MRSETISGGSSHADPIQEGERVLRICNSCRYCEGYCAVFPAMERRRIFAEGDLNYLANLCHNCGECYYACQYAPPHEFAVNVPKLLAELRTRSWRRYAWPGPLRGRWSEMAAGLAGLLFAIAALLTAPAGRRGDFYSVASHAAMVRVFGALSIFALIAFVVGFARFWRESGERLGSLFQLEALREAIGDALKLRYLDGGGGGCSYPAERQSQSRRWFHHCVFYGFGLCFASTTTAAFYHYALGWRAPYGYFSAPVVLGTCGGVGLLAGTAGLGWLRKKRNPATQQERDGGAGFLALLFLSSLSGLLLLAFRQSAAMRSLLIVHLTIVAVLFVTLPYGKFAHAIYRPLALFKHALEGRRQHSRPSA